MICPKCLAEYQPGVSVCADCSVQLIPSLPPSLPVYECPTCLGEIDGDNDFCPHCGHLFTKDTFSCDTHPEKKSEAVCVICHRLMCDECFHHVNDRLLCDDHVQIEISEGWALVFSSADYMEAQIMRGKLESAGIIVNPVNTTNIGMMLDGVADNALGRALVKYPVKVFVPLHQYLDAVDIMNA